MTSDAPPMSRNLLEDNPSLLANLGTEDGREGISQRLDESRLGLGVQSAFEKCSGNQRHSPSLDASRASMSVVSIGLSELPRNGREMLCIQADAIGEFS